MIRVNMEKARAITHDRRRIAREREFAPHDAVIAKQIPGKSASEAKQIPGKSAKQIPGKSASEAEAREAEASRAVIRAKYDAMQAEISGAADPEALKAIIEREGL